jgi:hypothetical protein
MHVDHLAILKEYLHYFALVKIINFLMLNCLNHLVYFHQRVQVKAAQLLHLLIGLSFLLPHFHPFMIMIAKEYPKINLKA